MLDSLRNNCRDVDRAFLTLEHIEPGHPRHVPLEEFQRRLASATGTVLVKTHSLPDASGWQDARGQAYAAKLLADTPTVYVHRDGRDVLVSLYNYLASFTPEVAATPFKSYIRAVYKGGEGAGFDRAAFWQRHVQAWLDRGSLTTGGYENLETDYVATVSRVATEAGLTLRSTVEPIEIERGSRLKRRARRLMRRALRLDPRSSAIHPRAGVAGRYRAMFDDEDLAWFESRAGAAMRLLGYQPAATAEEPRPGAERVPG